MKHKICLASLALLLLAGCKSNPNKAEPIDTHLTSAEKVSGTAQVGINSKNEMVVMDKQAMSERLRDLQNTVYGLEDSTYGTRKLGTYGLYGELKSCMHKLSSRQYGGSGQLLWTEPLDRLTDKEEPYKMGVDEQKRLVGVSEEYLRQRVERYQGYRMILQKRHDEFQSRIEGCKNQIAEKQFDGTADDKVVVTELNKGQINKEALNEFMCAYAKQGASLEDLLVNAFAKGWLSLKDFNMKQDVTVGGVTDGKGETFDNGFMFHGWKLAYDNGPLTVGGLLGEGKDAKLVAWSYSRNPKAKEAPNCIQMDVWKQ